MSASERRHAPSPAFAALGLAADPALVLILGATLVGLALRAAAATGDLGLDEIWSLRLVGRVPSFGGVFWGISHDNNHFLNSAWLFLLGQNAPVWAYRLPALVMGTLTVPALARLCGRANPAAGPFAAAVGAVALPLVDFGSEARGYAGLVLATVLAVEAAGRAVDATLAGDHAACRRAAWRLGAAIGLGLASHLTMADGAAVLGVATLIRLEAHRNRRRALSAALRIFLPSALLALPVAGFILAGIAVRGTFTIGDTDPFTLGKLVAGFGGMALRWRCSWSRPVIASRPPGRWPSASRPWWPCPLRSPRCGCPTSSTPAISRSVPSPCSCWPRRCWAPCGAAAASTSARRSWPRWR